MKATVKVFALARQLAGQDQIQVELPSGPRLAICAARSLNNSPPWPR